MKFKHAFLGAALTIAAIASSCGVAEAGLIAKAAANLLHIAHHGKPPVTEAATWAMMLFGLVLMGGGLHLMQDPQTASPRRSRAARAAADLAAARAV